MIQQIRKNWVEMNDESRETYNAWIQIKLKTSMTKSILCDYSDACIHVKGSITVTNTGTAATPNNRNKKVIFKNCVPFINCISEISNIQVDDAHDIDVVMPMYDLIEYSDTFTKTSGSLYQYYRDEPVLNNNVNIINFLDDDNNSISFKFKQQITGQTRKMRQHMLK